MIKLLLGISFFLTGPAFAAVQLPWTKNAKSVQAILYTALDEYQQNCKSKLNGNWVRRGAKGKLTVGNGSNTLVCETRSSSGVQSYRCTISKPELDAVRSSDSAPAVLDTALRDLLEADQASSSPQGYVKFGKNGELVVEDGFARFICDSFTKGMMPAQIYTCKLEIK